MATVKNYYTFGGELIGEQILGGERLDYLSDPLGNVTATVNQSCQIVNSYEDKPYGEQLSKTGSGSDPACRWVGVHGYRSTGLKYAEVYVRRRHYSTELGRWTSRDPLWPQDLAYSYVAGRVGNLVDPSGLYGIQFQSCDRGLCGMVRYIISLFNSFGEPPGWFIQHMFIRLTETYCQPVASSLCLPLPCLIPAWTTTRYYELYEAWRVNEWGQIFCMCPGPPWNPSPCSTDHFEYLGRGQCYRGQGHWFGKMKFFKNYNLTSPPWRCGCHGGVARDLPCFVPGTDGGSKPPGYNGQYSLPHEMRMEWDCCPNVNRTVVNYVDPSGPCRP